MTLIKSWFLYANKAWISLLLGWIAVLVSSTPFITLDQSGALLICSVVIAEIFLKNGYQSFMEAMGPCIRTNFTYLESKFPHSNEDCIKIVASQTKSEGVYVNSSDWLLYHMATKKEFFGTGQRREWLFKQTLNRVETRIEYILVANIVIGTILWAFG
jgi:hypothetical protein